MKILFISLEIPYPPTNGLAMRSWSVARGLAECGHEVTVLGFGSGAAAGAASGCEVLPPVRFQARSLSGSYAPAARLRALAKGQSFSAARFECPEMRERIAKLLRDRPFDTVVADTVFSAVNLPAEMPVPFIVNTHNLEHLLLRRYAARELRPAHRLYAELEWRRLRAWETQVWRRARLVLACSEFDRAAIERLAPATHGAVVPNVIDVDAYAPEETSTAPTLLYSGGLDWFPNRDAVTFFTERMLPRLRRRMPDVRLVLAGRNGPREWQRRLARVPGVECLGPVSDMRAAIAAAAVCIVPLRIGSGTRLKILEAAAMAKPVVSTRLGAEGLDFHPGRDILLADRPEAFVDHLVRLLSDAGLRQRIGGAARNTVERIYSQSALVQHLHRALAAADTDSAPAWARTAAGEAVPS